MKKIMVPTIPEQPVRRSMGLLGSAIHGVRGILPEAALPKGVRHPDKLIHRKDLYLPGGTKVTPTGKTFGPSNWRELYFPRKTVPVEASAVFGALKEGYTDMDQIGIITGMNRTQVTKGYNYLKSHGLLKEIE